MLGLMVDRVRGMLIRWKKKFSGVEHDPGYLVGTVLPNGVKTLKIFEKNTKTFFYVFYGWNGLGWCWLVLGNIFFSSRATPGPRGRSCQKPVLPKTFKKHFFSQIAYF